MFVWEVVLFFCCRFVFEILDLDFVELVLDFYLDVVRLVVKVNCVGYFEFVFVFIEFFKWVDVKCRFWELCNLYVKLI